MIILTLNYVWPPLGDAMRDMATELSKRHEVSRPSVRRQRATAEESHHDGSRRIFQCKVWMRRATAVASVLSMLLFYPAGVLLGRQLVRHYSCEVVNTWVTIPSGPTGVHVARYDGLPHVRSIIGGAI